MSAGQEFKDFLERITHSDSTFEFSMFEYAESGSIEIGHTSDGGYTMLFRVLAEDKEEFMDILVKMSAMVFLANARIALKRAAR